MLIDNIIDLYNYVEYLRGIICILRARVHGRKTVRLTLRNEEIRYHYYHIERILRAYRLATYTSA